MALKLRSQTARDESPPPSAGERRHPAAVAREARDATTTPACPTPDVWARQTCSVAEAAVALGLGRSTAYKAARDGTLPVLRVSHRLLVPTAKLAAMLGIGLGRPWPTGEGADPGGTGQ